MKSFIAVLIVLLVFDEKIIKVNELLHMSTVTHHFRPPMVSKTKLYHHLYSGLAASSSFNPFFNISIGNLFFLAPKSPKTCHSHENRSINWFVYVLSLLLSVLTVILRDHVWQLLLSFQLLHNFLYQLHSLLVGLGDIGSTVCGSLKYLRKPFERQLGLQTILLRTIDVLISLLNPSEPIPQRHPIESEATIEDESAETPLLALASESAQNQRGILLLLHDLYVLTQEMWLRLKKFRFRGQQPNNESNAQTNGLPDT